MATIRETLGFSNPNSPKSEELPVSNQPVMKRLSTADLTSGLKYQRTLKLDFIEDKIKHFDPNKVRPIIVSYRNGKYYVIDGQHTIMICKGHNGGKDCIVNCLVLTGLTETEESKLFSEQDKDKHRLSSTDLWRSNEIAQNERTLAVINGIRKAGVKIDFQSKTTNEKNRVYAYETAGKIYDKLGSRQFNRTMSLINNTYRDQNNGFSKLIMEGTGEFVYLYGKEMSDETFAKKLSKVSPDKVIEEAKTDKLSPNNAVKVAKVMFKYYNSRAKKKLISKFAY